MSKTVKQMKQARIQMCLDVISSMVKNGFTFFSSVYMDSSKCASHNPKFRREGDWDCVEHLYFHIPGKQCLVRMQVNQWDYDDHTRQHLYLNADVYMSEMEYSFGEYGAVQKYMAMKDLARPLGFTKMVPEHDLWPCDDVEIISIPWFEFGVCDLFSRWQLGFASSNDGYFHRRIEASDEMYRVPACDASAAVTELCEYITKLLPFIKDGKFKGLSLYEVAGHSYATWNAESGKDSRSEEEFHQQFGARYFRQHIV